MRSSEKKLILVLILITIVVIKVNKDKKGEIAEGAKAPEAGYVEETQDGIKQAKSSKLAKTKTFGDFEIGNIQITEVNGTATLTASVKNISGQTKNEFPIKLKLLNEAGEVLEELGAYVGTINSGETRGINASINMDISQVYDIKVEI